MPTLTLVNRGIEDYVEDKCDPVSGLLNKLVAHTESTTDCPQMLTGRVEGRFLKMMVQLLQAKRVLEIGMFTGYSALSMAEGLPEDGELVTLDINKQFAAVAQSYFDRSEHGRKIEIKLGPALDSIKQLKGYFDLVFIDADKGNYVNYYEAVLPLVRPGGLIIADNVLYSGLVLDSSTEDQNARGIIQFNDHVKKDERVDRVMLTVRDGVYLLRKR